LYDSLPIGENTTFEFFIFSPMDIRPVQFSMSMAEEDFIDLLR
jgi:hypothetical protein